MTHIKNTVESLIRLGFKPCEFADDTEVYEAYELKSDDIKFVAHIKRDTIEIRGRKKYEDKIIGSAVYFTHVELALIKTPIFNLLQDALDKIECGMGDFIKNNMQ